MKKRRPSKFGDCKNIPEPCPWISCKYHLLFERAKIIRSHMNMTDEEILDQLPAIKGKSCSLKVAKKPQTLQAIGDIFGVGRERIRQIEHFRKEGAGALYELLKSRDYRLILKGYYECEIKSFETS